MRFPGGEALTVAAILEAPREVVAKSAHSTLYRAGLSAGEAVALLRFVRPACAAGAEEAAATARVLGATRHPNLVQHGPSLPRRWWWRGTGSHARRCARRGAGGRVGAGGRRERPTRGGGPPPLPLAAGPRRGGAEQQPRRGRSSGRGGDSVVIPSPSRPPGVCIYSVSQGTVACPIRLLLPLRGRSWPAPSAHHGHHRRPSVVRRAAVAFSRLRTALSDSCHRHAVLPPLLMPAHGDMILHLHLVDSIAVVINS